MGDIDYMRRAGKLAAQTLDYITSYVQPGISTGELDRLCDQFMNDNGGISACLGYGGISTVPFPKSVCTSVNHIVCHGIPNDEKILHEGDIINIDVTVILDGWHGDTSRMFYIGKPKIRAQKLVEATYDAMMAGIEVIKPGATVGDVGHATEQMAKKHGFPVVREYCGHGIGTIFHGQPQIPFYGEPGEGIVLKPGMFFTVEPMLTAGKPDTLLLDDQWTVVTRDKKWSAQYEHTIAVTDDGFEIMTLSS